MKTLTLSKELHDQIEDLIWEHNEVTHNSVDFGDILYTFFNNEDFTGSLHILLDWDEGKNNDPYWDEVLDEHSAISFIRKMCVIIWITQ